MRGAVQSATLIIWGGDFDPDDVTRRLGMRPSQAWRKGEQKSFRAKDGLVRQFTSRHRWSGWKKCPGSGVRRTTLHRQLVYWVAKLQPKANVLQTLRRRGIAIELNCFVAADSHSLHLPSDLVVSIGKLGADLEVTWDSGGKARSNKPLQPTSGGPVGVE